MDDEELPQRHEGWYLGFKLPPYHLPGTPDARTQGCVCPDQGKVPFSDPEWHRYGIHPDCRLHKVIPASDVDS